MTNIDACTPKKKPYINLVGIEYGKLTVISLVDDVASAKVPTRWLCRCKCGNEVVVRGYNLRSGNTKSCGCEQKEKAAARLRTHGGKGTRLYVIWQHMLRRCNSESYLAYRLYGGRGITVCKEWHEFEAFRDWALRNGYDENLTIDRIDVNGNYEAKNCRWVTQQEQNLNKRNNIRIAFDGEVKTLSEWANVFGCTQSVVCRNILEREGRIIRCDGGGMSAIEQ